jgi:predicted RNase H-like HicB family nuclease
MKPEDLPGCISQGKPREAALANIKEAIYLYIEVLQEHNKPISDDQIEVFCSLY